MPADGIDREEGGKDRLAVKAVNKEKERPAKNVTNPSRHNRWSGISPSGHAHNIFFSSFPAKHKKL